MICCESIVQMLGTWHFILTLDDSTSHINATSAPLDCLKNISTGLFSDSFTIPVFKTMILC